MATKMEKFLILMFTLACLMIACLMIVAVLRLWDKDKQTLAEVTQNYTKVATECRVLKEENEQLRQLISDKN